ncbi:MAG: hypothetical protein WBA68_08205 [Alteraurantiacibacter sp.]
MALLWCGTVTSASATATAQSIGSARTEFQPVTPWNIDYADDSCALVRRFSDGERQIWFELRGVAPVDRVRLTLGTDRLGVTNENLHISVFPGREPLTPSARFIEGDSDIANAVVSTVSLNDFRVAWHRSLAEGSPHIAGEGDVREDRPAVAGIQVAEAFDETLVLWTGDMEAALQALDVCMGDLVGSWGIDPAELAQAATRPSALERDVWEPMVQRYYPRTGKRRSRNTTFPIVLLVNPQGGVARCASPNATGDEDFLQVACAALMEYARFEPARTADGRAVHGFWWTGMVYGIY